MNVQAVAVDQKQKIQELKDLALLVEQLKVRGKTIVHCHGVFDLLHVGHIWHLQQAKAKGDVLVVTLTPDHFVNKGPHRPAFEQELRAEALAALDVVDFVAVNDWPTAVEAISLIKPDFYVKGSDYKRVEDDNTGKIADEQLAVEAVGGKIFFTEGRTFSSSTLINQHLSQQPEETQEYLRGFRERWSAEDIVGYLDSLQDLKVLVVGETIIDEYQYCEAIGKSSKEPTLVVKLDTKEVYPGGVLNIANHSSDFAGTVGLVTQLGEVGDGGQLVSEVVDGRVASHLLVRHNAPTIVKRRYVDKYFFSKLFETYEINDGPLEEADEQALCALLEREVPRFDLVIAADYGHGLFSDRVIQTMSGVAKRLAVNVQSNAGNLGYQSMQKYAGAHFFSVDENEIRLEARSRRGEIEPIMEGIFKQLTCESLVVTRGKRGSVCRESAGSLVEVPAFAGKVIDRVGAGDAFLTIAAMCEAKGVPMEVGCFLGNVAGALSVATVGNKKPVTKLDLIRSVESLLK